MNPFQPELGRGRRSCARFCSRHNRACQPLTLLLLLSALPAPNYAKQLSIQVFSVKNGLPRNRANCLTATPGGFLWICTSEGLARFDGYRFRVFGAAEGLPSRTIYDFKPSRNGGFWVLTDRGLCRLKPDSRIGEPCRLLAADDHPGEFEPEGVLETSSGQTWVVTTKCLLRLSPDGQRLLRAWPGVPPAESLSAFAESDDGALLVGTDQGLYEWREGHPLQPLSNPGQLGPTDMLRMPSGQVWLATSTGLFRMNRTGPEWRWSLQQVGARSLGQATTLLVRRNGDFWVGGMEGMVRLVLDQHGRTVPAEHLGVEELPYPGVEFLTEDAQGNLWGATGGGGIFRISDSGITSYGEKDGLGLARIISVLEGLDGRICVRTNLNSRVTLVVQGEHGFVPVALPRPSGPDIGWGWNQFGFQARDGEWWFPSASGLIRYPRTARVEDLARQQPLAVYAADSLLGANQIFRLFEDATGDIWISAQMQAQAKLLRWERKTGHFHDWTNEEGWVWPELVSAIRQSPTGTIWFGAFGRLIRYRNGRFQSFLPDGSPPPVVRDLHIDAANRVWVASQSGLLRCDNPESDAPVFQIYTPAQGLSANSTRSVLSDRSGFVYVGTVVGIDRIDPAAPLESRRVLHFTWTQGLPESEQNAAFRDSRGHLWFGSLHGLTEIDPSRIQPLSRPRVYLDRLRVRGQDVRLPWEGTQQWSLDLTSNRNQVEVEYAGVDLGSRSPLSYQYRMVGVDSRWSPAVDQSAVNYADLPADNLRFEVRALNADDQASMSAAALALAVQAPLWRRWWFLLGIAALAGGTSVLLYNYRVGQLLAFERLRTRIATDLHDDIGASLSQISILSEVARNNSQPEVLSEIANIARAIVQDMSDIVWAVNPRHDRFEALVHRMRRFASDTFGAADIDLSFETKRVEADFFAPLEMRRPLYLVFKEAVNNAVCHSGASAAAVRLAYYDSSIHLEVEDNGRGFDPGVIPDGEGLLSMQRRAGEVGGTVSWRTQHGAGTLVTAVFPFRVRRPRSRWWKHAR